MPHIHTGEDQHDLTATAYIARIDGDEPRAMLHMHKLLHVLLPVGGHVELGETPWQAMSHELEEESGYTLDQLEVLQPLSRMRSLTKVVQHPYPLVFNTHAFNATHFHTDVDFGFVTSQEPASEIGDDESHDVRWLTATEIDALPEKEIYDNTREIYQFLLKTALHEWERVPTNEFLLKFPDDFRR